MNNDLDTLLLLRRTLVALGRGQGLANSLVLTFAHSVDPTLSVAQLSLLGHPPNVALAGLTHDQSAEVSMLASLLANSTRGSTSLAGQRGEKLSLVLERWLKSREARRMETRVLRFRGLVMSAVLGAVMAIVSTLAPVLGSLSFGAPQPQVDPFALKYGALAMSAVSSAMLGFFVSGRGMAWNLLLSVAIFGLVSAATSPLSSLPAVSMWGIK